MKSKDKKELHQKSTSELRKMVTEAKDALVLLKMEKIQNKLKNPRQLSIKRREIAQMMTIIRMKELAETQVKKK
jgi:ribosomal protein L29